jgi:hypothetical protein
VLCEETDEVSPNNFMSHYELYLFAMKDIGANTSHIEKLVQNVSNGANVRSELVKAKIPPYVKAFVSNTLDTVEKPLPYIASSFFFGREDPIPDMFSRFVKTIPDERQYSNLKIYLNRHIQIDGEEHGPLSMKLLEEISEDREDISDTIINSACNAIDYRIKLWDGILDDINSKK